jgi:hypothetical protein
MRNLLVCFSSYFMFDLSRLENFAHFLDEETESKKFKQAESKFQKLFQLNEKLVNCKLFLFIEVYS